MDKPRIELRGIKHSAFASQETHCYQATLYVDGKKWGTVSNEGHGGADYVYLDRGRTQSDLAELGARIAATYPPYEYEGGTLTQNLEMVCGDLVNQWLTERDFRRSMANSVLFTKPGVPGIWSFKVKKPHNHAQTLAAARAKFPNYVYLSDLPEAEAKEIFCKID